MLSYVTAVVMLSAAAGMQERKPECRCEDVFAFVADYVERNYAGFGDKVSDATRDEYAEHRQALHARARGLPAAAECHGLLREYTGFFRDPHMAVAYDAPSTPRPSPDKTSGHDAGRHPSRELELRELDADTLLLRLPDFNPTLKSRIDALIEANRDRLAGTRNLIIDVRRNPGGSTANFAAVLPFLYTKPITTPGMSHYATDDNIRMIESFLEENELAEDLEAEIGALVSRMKEHRGGFVPAEDEVFTLPRVLPYPERVAVLADRGCVSSCETFVWKARQSDKVTVFGEDTAGFLDYGDVLPVPTPCGAFRLFNPTSRSNRVAQGMPLDNVGIEPDVRIPADVPDPVDWVRERLDSRAQR